MDAINLTSNGTTKSHWWPYHNHNSVAITTSGYRIVIAGRRRPSPTSPGLYCHSTIPAAGTGFLWFDSEHARSKCLQDDLPIFYGALHRRLLHCHDEDYTRPGDLHTEIASTSNVSADPLGMSITWVGHFKDLEQSQDAFPTEVRRAFRMRHPYPRMHTPMDAPISFRERAPFIRFLRAFHAASDTL